jgi:chromosome transmission fidelity protein 4
MDCLDDELTTDDIISREKAMDKEFILLIQMACKSDDIPRAIELTKLLHHNVSFDAAMKIANFYHLVGLKEKIAIIKADREETEDRLILARNKRRRWLEAEPPLRQLATPTIATSHFDPLGDSRPPPTIERPGMTRVTVPVIERTRYSSAAPSIATSHFDPLGDSQPPPTIERPGMARVTVPVIERTRYSSAVPSTQTPERSTWDDPLAPDSPPSTDGKRKHADLESFPSSDMPPPKISK